MARDESLPTMAVVHCRLSFAFFGVRGGHVENVQSVRFVRNCAMSSAVTVRWTPAEKCAMGVLSAAVATAIMPFASSEWMVP